MSMRAFLIALAIAVAMAATIVLLAPYPEAPKNSADYVSTHNQCAARDSIVRCRIVVAFDWLGDRDNLTATSTTAIAALTLVLAWIGRIQIRDTRILQRAYIAVEPAGVEPYIDGSGRFSPNVLILNAGNLPASDVEWRVHWQFAHSADYEPTLIEESLGGSIVLPPKGSVLKGDGSGIPTLEFVDSSLDDAHWLFVWGKVTYRDGFRKGRFIKFCHRYFVLDPMILGPGHFHVDRIDKDQARHHEYANGTDEN